MKPCGGKTAQGLKGMVLEKKFFLPIESWFLPSFHFVFCSRFFMMSSSM
jgi:hypothetical protein